MYKNLTVVDPPETRTMEVHQVETGWYCTIHKNNELVWQSALSEDRVEITKVGMEYLETLRTLQEQQKGKTYEN